MVRLAHLVLPVLQVPQARPVLQVFQVLQEPRDLAVQLDHRVPPGLLAHLELLDKPGHQVGQVLPVHREQRVHLDLRVLQEVLVLVDYLEGQV